MRYALLIAVLLSTPAWATTATVVHTAGDETDIDTALTTLAAGGPDCTLIFPAGTWTGVNFVWPTQCSGNCDIHGAGIAATKLQAIAPQTGKPLIWIKTASVGSIHDIELDGVKATQNPVNGFDASKFVGVECSNQTATPTGAWSVSNANVHDFVRMGLHFRQCANSVVASTVHLRDMGCFDDGVSCPLIGTAAGVLPSDNPEAQNSTPPIATVGWGVMFETAQGSGGEAQGTCENVTKHCYEAFSSAATGFSDSINNVYLHNITCNNAGTDCTVSNGGAYTRMDNVTAVGTPGHNGQLILCTGFMAGCSITNSSATGAGLQGISMTGFALGSNAKFTNNTVSGSCSVSTNGLEEVRLQGDSGGARGGTLIISGNTIGAPGATCPVGLRVRGWAKAYAANNSITNGTTAVDLNTNIAAFVLDWMTMTFGVGIGISATTVTGTVGNHNVFIGSGTQLSQSGSTISDWRGQADSVLAP